jgi:ABC-type multidrug transport system fused ATPase/permease subunit
VWATLPRALKYLRPYKALAIGALLVTLLGAAAGLAEPWPLAILLDSVLGHKRPPGIVTFLTGGADGRYTILIFIVLLGFFVALVAHGLGVLSTWFSAKIEQRIILDFRSDLFTHAQGLSLTFHDARQTGQTIYQINLHAAALGAILVAIPPILQALLSLIGMFVIVTLIDWQVAIVSLVAVPFIWYSLGVYGKRIVPRVQRVQGLEWESLSIVYEAISMLRVIVSFGRERHEFRRFRSQGEQAVEQRIRLTLSQTMFSLGVTMATALGTGLVLGFGAWHVIKGRISTGELVVLISYIASVYQPLEQLGSTIGSLNDQFVMFNTGISLLDVEPEVKQREGAIDIGRSTGRVTYDAVDFAYYNRADVLTQISLEVEPHQRVAIVGPTGAGKTTMINLLVRFYEPKAGRILIDGVDIRDLTLASLRNQISLVHQDPMLFSGSIADNIRYGRLESTREDVIAAAKQANAHDFIERLPDGYDTLLGERGAQLSGGERQRVAVARAFIRDAPILILDEPTSAIDSKTEEVILDALDDLMVGRTSFMIAHRLSTIRDADLIVVLKDGQIVEQGSHDELIDRPGLYRQLFEAQTRRRRRRVYGPDGEPLSADDFDAISGSVAEPDPRQEPDTVTPSDASPRRNVEPAIAGAAHLIPPAAGTPSPPLLHLGGDPQLRLAQHLSAALATVRADAERLRASAGQLEDAAGNGHGSFHDAGGNGDGNGGGEGRR